MTTQAEREAAARLHEQIDPDRNGHGYYFDFVSCPVCALIAAALAEAVRREREACEKLCDTAQDTHPWTGEDGLSPGEVCERDLLIGWDKDRPPSWVVTRTIKAFIRARGESKS